MKKLLISLLFVIAFISIASAASPSLGTFQSTKDIEVLQTCAINGSICDLCNISSINYPNGSAIVSDVAMTKRTSDFNYTLKGGRTVDIHGEYLVNGFCDFGTDVRRPFVYAFDVTPSGQGGRSLTSYYWLIIVLVYAMLAMGVWKSDISITLLGTFGLYFIGIYILYFGIDVFKNFLTEGFAIITLGLAGYMSTIMANEYLIE